MRVALPAMLREKHAHTVARLLQGAEEVLFAAQISRCDWEHVLPSLLVGIVLGLEDEGGRVRVPLATAL